VVVSTVVGHPPTAEHATAARIFRINTIDE